MKGFFLLLFMEEIQNSINNSFASKYKAVSGPNLFTNNEVVGGGVLGCLSVCLSVLG